MESKSFEAGVLPMTPTEDLVPLKDTASPRELGPIEQLVYSTVRIECEYGAPGFVNVAPGRGTGTGFFFGFGQNGARHIPAIVTNKHVVEGAARGALTFHTPGPNGFRFSDKSQRIVLDNFRANWLFHPDPTIDLCVMPIARLVEYAKAKGTPITYLRLGMAMIPGDEEFASLTHMEEILMIGYPNGIWDSVNNMPILRRGITATHPGLAYNGRNEFMIDAACFPGSSGSPVLLYNAGSYFVPGKGLAVGTRIKLLGILRAGPQQLVTGDLQIVDVPTRQDVQAISRIPINLGVVIRSSELRYFEEELPRLSTPGNPPNAPTATGSLGGTA